MKEPEWIEWNGGNSCPISDEQGCELQMQDGRLIATCAPGLIDWRITDDPDAVRRYRCWRDLEDFYVHQLRAQGYLVTAPRRVIRVNDREVPAPLMDKPERRAIYWYIDTTDVSGVKSKGWFDDDLDNRLLDLGLIHRRYEDARAYFFALINPQGASYAARR